MRVWTTTDTRQDKAVLARTHVPWLPSRLPSRGEQSCRLGRRARSQLRTKAALIAGRPVVRDRGVRTEPARRKTPWQQTMLPGRAAVSGARSRLAVRRKSGPPRIREGTVRRVPGATPVSGRGTAAAGSIRCLGRADLPARTDRGPQAAAWQTPQGQHRVPREGMNPEQDQALRVWPSRSPLG